MWTDVGSWLQSPAGQRTLLQVVPPIVAVLLAAALAALLVRSALRSRQREAARARAVSAVVALVGAGRRERGGQADGRAESELRLRLSGLPGAAIAADWARSRVGGGVGADAVTDRMTEWLRRPRRARRIFTNAAPAVLDRTDPRVAPDTAPSGVRAVPAEPAVSAVAVTSEPGNGPSPIESTPGRAPERAVEPGDLPGRVRQPTEAGTEEADAPSVDSGEGPPRHSRGEDAPQRPQRQAVPAWLDTYDDDAAVTRDIPLKPPSPVPASTVGERNRTDEGVVPRP